MYKTIARILFTIAAIDLAFGGILHAKAFSKAASLLDGANLPAFYTNSFKALWLIDSAILISVALLCLVVAFRKAETSRSILVLIAAIPGATAGLIYTLVGSFFPAHML